MTAKSRNTRARPSRPRGAGGPAPRPELPPLVDLLAGLDPSAPDAALAGAAETLARLLAPARVRILRVADAETSPSPVAEAGDLPAGTPDDSWRRCLRSGRAVAGPGPRLCLPLPGASGAPVGVLEIRRGGRGGAGAGLARRLEEWRVPLGFLLERQNLLRGLEEQARALRRSEELYRSIVENAADPILLLDPEGHVTWVNAAACARLGYPRATLVGMNVGRIVKKGHLHALYLTLREVLDGREARPLRLEVLTAVGEERTVEMACAGIRDAGRVRGVSATLRDITDRVVIDKLKKNYLKSLEEAVVERTAEIKETQRAAILAIATLAESIDEDTGGHLQRIRHYSRLLADDLRQHSPYRDRITEEYVELIYDLSPLHDLGKVGIRDYILQKPDKLTSDEFEKMKDHAEIGARALRMAGQMIHRESIFSIGEMIARYHHERWDGTGYPAVEIGGEVRPLRGEEIPLCARIVALADVYDALTSRRPYKMPFPHEHARDMIVAQSGKHFDPEVVRAFLRREGDFVKIREQFPDTDLPEGRPFELPARDRS
jgi:PAS domain S-box-containing protein